MGGDENQAMDSVESGAAGFEPRDPTSPSPQKHTLALTERGLPSVVVCSRFDRAAVTPVQPLVDTAIAMAAHHRTPHEGTVMAANYPASDTRQTRQMDRAVKHRKVIVTPEL